MKFFEKYYNSVDFTGKTRVKVACPFHQDTVESGIINVEDSTFHCFACNIHYTESQFMAKLNGISVLDANQVLSQLEISTNTWEFVEKAELWASQALLNKVRALGLRDTTIDSLSLGLVKDDYGNILLGFPVFYNGILVDVGRYNVAKINGIPKMQSNTGAVMGYVVPFDLWKTDMRTTYLFEGQKDMAIARELGLNAITLTGGAGALPNAMVLDAFKGRKVVICYDNDDAGRKGIEHVFTELKTVAKEVKYVDIAQLVPEDKGDFWDAIMVKHLHIDAFLALPELDVVSKDTTDTKITLSNALNNNIFRKMLRSPVLISAEYGDVYAVPTMVKFTKTGRTNDSDLMTTGESRTWYLKNENIRQLLSLIEVGADDKGIITNTRTWVGIPSKESGITVKLGEYQTIYKIRVTDSTLRVSEDSDNDKKFFIDFYTFQPVNVGAEYFAEYIIFPHPTKNQKLVAIATRMVELDTEHDFKLSKKLLEPFVQKMPIQEKLGMLYESMKHYTAPHLNFDLWLMADLVFNSVLQFQFGDLIRGALDVFILGDTHVGKSETTGKMTNLYDFGHFLSLKNSTTLGLIGGSKKEDNSMLNTIGAIPRQHKKLVVLEEFSGAPPSFIKTMTDIRSSGKIHITRVAGELVAPCVLRTITISNPINDETGQPRFLSTFPNGVAPLMELIKSAEDVARYDAFMLVPTVTTRINPFKNPLRGTPIPKECYEHKARWVYTRKPENVKFEDGVQAYIWDKAEELNEEFESNFPVFSVATNLKLARFSVALASLLGNLDETYENIIVTKEIVDYMVYFLKKLYDNPVFKLKEYKREYDKYSEVSDREIVALQNMYSKNSVVLDYLYDSSFANSINLRIVSGMEPSAFNTLFAELTKAHFIKIVGNSVFPTPKFRKTMALIDRGFHADTEIITYDEKK